MGQVPSSTLHRTTRGFHVHPEEVPQEWSLQVVVDFMVVDHPHQLIHR